MRLDEQEDQSRVDGDAYSAQPLTASSNELAIGTYKTVLADPPWLERGGGRIKRGADRHYPLMSTGDIARLPVGAWAAPNAHLYLWVTNNFLEDGLQVMRAWGFRYVTAITWMKDRIGLGQYFRGNTEHCLFGVRGQLPYRMDAGKRQQGVTGFTAPRGEHSRKPEELRQMVERVSYGPYLELFARRRVAGWDAWGNQIDSADRSDLVMHEVGA